MLATPCRPNHATRADALLAEGANAGAWPRPGMRRGCTKSRRKNKRSKTFPNSSGFPPLRCAWFGSQNMVEPVHKIGRLQNRFDQQQAFARIFVLSQTQQRAADF